MSDTIRLQEEWIVLRCQSGNLDAYRELVELQETYSSEMHERYRKEVEKMLDKKSKALRRERRITYPMWIYIVVLCTVFLLIGGFSSDPTTKLWFGIMACFWLIMGAVFILKYFINRNWVEMLKEMKEIQLRISELQDKIE